MFHRSFRFFSPLAAVTFLALPALAQSTGEARNFLSRRAPAPMGENNAVQLWVKTDSVMTLRLRVAASSSGLWISSPISLAPGAWRAVTIPKSDFTLRASSARGLNPMLPADAQGTPTPISPKWSAADTLIVETNVPKTATIYLDDAAWVTLDSTGKEVDETSVDDFEKGNVAAWDSLGTAAQSASLSYGLATQLGAAHGGKVAFKLDIQSPATRRQTLQLPAAKKAMAGKPYLIWTPPTLFDAVIPTSLPPAVGTARDVLVTACAGQTQASSFCIYSAKALTDVSANIAGDLQGIGKTLPKTSVAVNVVKVWTQSGVSETRDPDLSGLTPELLVKDDRIKLSGMTPVIPLVGPALTEIPADTSKQFWLTVSVPSSAKPGTYVGRIVVSGKGLTIPIFVRFTLTVPAIRLLSPAKQYAVNLRSRLDPAPAPLPSADGNALVTDFVSRDVLDKQLTDLVAHGVTIATLYDSPDTLWDAVSDYKIFGLGTAYNLYKGDGDPAAIEAARRSHNAPPLTFFTPSRPSAAYVVNSSDYDAGGKILELPIYNRDGAYSQMLVRTKGQRVSDKRDWWFWPVSNEKPTENRLSAGLLLWRANLYGAFLPAYQTVFGSDPYDDSSSDAPANKADFRPEMLTYPVEGGVLDTIQWEAVREGVTDVRYLTTLYTALRECKDAKIAAPLVSQAETYVTAFLGKPLSLLTDADLDKFRANVLTYAVKLRTTVDAYNKKRGIQ